MEKYRVFDGSEMISAVYDTESRLCSWFFAWKDEGGRVLDEPVLVQTSTDCDGTSGYSAYRAAYLAKRLGFSEGAFARNKDSKLYDDGTISSLCLVAWGCDEEP